MDTDSELNFDANSVLDRDNVPNENQSTSCFSCDEPMVGLYCVECGQKNDNYRRSITLLGVELFSSLTAFEGRIWRSLRTLILSPGRMSREYSDGARQKWTSPVRMYLAMSLILFGYIAISGTQLIAFGTKPSSGQVLQIDLGNEKPTPEIYFFKRKAELKSLISEEAISALEDTIKNSMADDKGKSPEELKIEIDTNNKNISQMRSQKENMHSAYGRAGLQTGIDALVKRNNVLEELLSEAEKSKSEATENFREKEALESPVTDNDLDAKQRKTEGSQTPDVNEDVDNDGSWINISGPDGTRYALDGMSISKIATTALRQPERINGPIGRYIPRIMFLMMPFSMLMGAIFIRGKETAMLYDHLVHAAYIHAFSFLLLFFFILLVQFTNLPNLLSVYTLILLVYLPLSARRMFRRSWFKTIITSYGVGLVYTLIMGLILIGLLVSGALDIAREYSVSQN